MFHTRCKLTSAGLLLVMSWLVFLLALPDRSAAQTPSSRIVVFGDSLSDSGSAFVLLDEGITPPDYSLGPFLVAPAPYARGGHHLSNGATWIEQLARPLGLMPSVLPAFRGANPGATNYAVAAARAYEDGVNVNLTVQVSAFLQDFDFVAPSDALYVIQFGGNDVRDALVAYLNGQNGDAILQAALTAILANIQALYAAGARQFLIWNVPDVGVTPALRILDSISPGAAQFATLLTQTFNASLAVSLGQLSIVLSEINIVPFDAYGLLSAIVADPAGFGLTNVTTACVTPNVPPFACSNPDEYLFWDGIHPTKAVHTIIAGAIAALLAQ